tara:strand:- start:354 stop:662 length:309 start_codon:yes stop_codon:yes gene_type:complete
MNIKFKNDLENQVMIMTISWSRREKVSQPRLIMKPHEILKYARENYTPPEDYSLGPCVEGLSTADNDSVRRDSLNCVFQLLPKVQKKTVAKKTKKTTSKRKK